MMFDALFVGCLLLLLGLSIYLQISDYETGIFGCLALAMVSIGSAVKIDQLIEEPMFCTSWEVKILIIGISLFMARQVFYFRLAANRPPGCERRRFIEPRKETA